MLWMFYPSSIPLIITRCKDLIRMSQEQYSLLQPSSLEYKNARKFPLRKLVWIKKEKEMA